MQSWLARLSFSFIIIAAVLFYQAYKLSGAGGDTTDPWRLALYYAGAGLSLGLGLAGVRARHRGEK
jgi:hypothetical protein